MTLPRSLQDCLEPLIVRLGVDASRTSRRRGVR